MIRENSESKEAKFDNERGFFMEENEKMEKDVNLNNNGNVENVDKKDNNKGVIVVMIVIILVLILAIGTCIGFLFTGDTLKIINNKEEVVNEEENKSSESIVDEENNNKSNANDDKLQGQKSIFDEANNLKYTSNPKDNINGKIAVLKIGEKAFQTVMHDGYYTYTDNFSNSYNIKKITDITSEYIVTGNDNWANLFKCTVKYVDNNDKNKSFDIAVIVPTNSNDAYFMALYENYTGSTSFVKGFTNLYSYDYSNEYFKIELPNNWESVYEVEEGTLENGKTFTFVCKEHKNPLFTITALNVKGSEGPNFDYLGTDGELYYYSSVVVDGEVNFEHYGKLFENFDVKSSFHILKTNKQENNEKTYSQKELEQMALDYYERKTGYRPGSVASELQEDGTVVIQLYDNLGTHNSTSDWYTVNSKSAQGTDSLGNKIDLKK